MELKLPKSHEKDKCDLTISITRSNGKDYLLVLGPNGRDGKGEYLREEIRSVEKTIENMNSLNHEWSY